EAPFATQVPTLHIYVPESIFDDGRLEGVLSRGRLRKVDEGGRVILWPADKTALRLKKTSERDQLPVVSAPRLYADLLGFGGRGVDAAEHVREMLIDF
ncbi:MAG: type IV toxin-antitoxin system AbiEi family antitoxin, partial [Actinomycetota bacterium]|nr:type IV toxin-antitoxin system AbiEi family antitoxin [Actinomycetota bacterium]